MSLAAWLLCHARCECADCGWRFRSMARGAFTAFNLDGGVIAHICPSCVRDGSSLVRLPSRGVAFVKLAHSKFLQVFGAQPLEPEPRVLRELDDNFQMQRLRGSGDCWSHMARRGGWSS